MTPLSGRTLETTFTFACNGWEDPDLPLPYSFIYFTGDGFPTVLYKGMESSKKTKLPVGHKIKNFTIDFRVRVTVVDEVTVEAQVIFHMHLFFHDHD